MKFYHSNLEVLKSHNLCLMYDYSFLFNSYPYFPSHFHLFNEHPIFSLFYPRNLYVFCFVFINNVHIKYINIISFMHFKQQDFLHFFHKHYLKKCRENSKYRKFRLPHFTRKFIRIIYFYRTQFSVSWGK